MIFFLLTVNKLDYTSFEIIFWKGFKKRMNSFLESCMLRLISINSKISYEQ